MATGGLEETLNFKCTPCSKLNRQIVAVKYCVECQGYCCKSCVEMHEAFPAIKGHNFLDNSNFESTSQTINLPSVPTEICSEHEIKILDMYCGNHDVVGCASCMTLDHRNCSDVQLISNVAETLFKRADADGTLLKLNEKKIAMEKIKISKEALLEELKQSKEDAVNKIKALRAEMEVVLQKLEKASIEEVDKEFQIMEATLLEELKKCESQIKTLGLATLDMKQSNGNISQQFVLTKTVGWRISHTDNILNSFDEAVHAKVSFAVDRSILGHLQQLKSFGSFSRNTAYTIKEVKEMNIKIESDSSICSVYGSCLMEDNKLLVPDYNNKKIKRADVVKLWVLDYCDLPYQPRGVCCVDNQEAVVTLANCSIQFVSLGNQMKPTHNIKLRHPCFGIAYKNSTLLITANSTSLYIHDMDGTLLETISKNSSGNDIFVNCRHIAFSDSGHQIYVSDKVNNMVRLDRQGKHCDSATDSDLDNGVGVCTDMRGNVFVSACGSSNVVQFGQNGQKMGIVIKSSDGLYRPWSLAFSPQLCTLFVTEKDNDKVKVFELK